MRPAVFPATGPPNGVVERRRKVNLTQTAEWASLTGDDGGMTKGFASMILDQAICCLADLGFFSTALQVAKPPHTGKILRASTFSKLIHRTWERWHKRTMP